jgi:hypothetical protein
MRKRVALGRDIYMHLLLPFVGVQTWAPRQAEQRVFEIGVESRRMGRYQVFTRARDRRQHCSTDEEYH